MPTLLSTSRSEPFPIATMGDDEQQQASYKELIKQLAAQAPKPYGAIPPLLKKRKKKNAKHQRSSSSSEKSKSPTTRASGTPPPLPPSSHLPLLPQLQQQDVASPSAVSEQQRKPMRRMSHVEDWIVVDSKESLPDEEELTPFSTFLSADFFTQVLPLHMPPPSLSAPVQQTESVARAEPTPIPPPNKDPQVQSLDDVDDDDEEEEEDDVDDDDDEEEEHEDNSRLRKQLQRRAMHPNWKSDGEGDYDDDDDDDDDDDSDTLSRKSDLLAEAAGGKSLVRRHSISSFSNAQTPSTSTTASIAMSSSPPRHSNMQQVRLARTIAKLRWSLVVSSPPSSAAEQQQQQSSSSSTRKVNKKGLIPMPPPPRRPPSQRRRSEATTKPRFNPDTNTYTRDTRSNPDHLRIISAELNMIRARKLLSPLKPRGFLPRRKDPFIQGPNRRVSSLCWEVKEG